MGTTRCISAVMGSQLLVEEIFGYGIIGMMAISYDEAYTCAVAMYVNMCQNKSTKNYIPKSKRKNDILYLWGLELFYAIGILLWQSILAISSYRQLSRIRQKRITRRSPTVSNKRIAKTSSRYCRNLQVKHRILSRAIKKVTKNVQRLSTKCYMTQNRNTEDKSDKLNTWDTDSFKVKVDSGCNVSLSGDTSDFILGTLQEIKGRLVYKAMEEVDLW
jgi:hypothetical protein